MQANLFLIELILDHLCGTGRTSGTHERQLAQERAPSGGGPTLLRLFLYRLKHGCLACGRCPDRHMKDPRSILAVSSPDPQNCMCCWYQQFYNPTRPTDLLGLLGYGCLVAMVRLFPPIKPDEVNGICAQHIELLYPPRRARLTSRSASAQGAAGSAQAVEAVA